MNDLDLKENCNKLVVKHNKLVEFKGRMTTNELKLFSIIISDIREQQENTLEKYKIDISILKETTEHKDFYNYIKEVAFRLEEKSIEVERINSKGKKESFKMRLIYRPLITEDDSHLELLIDKDLIPYIIDLKREFTRYQIENILRLNSSYAVRIYELLKQYEKIGVREIEMRDLRHYLGIEKDEYSRFDNFEARVLLPAKKEIQNYTDLVIDYKKIKTGRKITSILFEIETKFQQEKIYIEFLDKTYNIKAFKEKSGIENENFDSKQVLELYEVAVDMLIDDYESEDDLFEYIRLNYVFMKEKKGVKNPFTYLKRALKEDYAVARAQIKLNYKI